MNRSKRLVIIQALIVLFLSVAIIGISFVSYDSGLLEETPILSLDPNADNYYLKRLNSEDITFITQDGTEYAELVRAAFPNVNITGVTGWTDMAIRTTYGKENAFLAEGGDKDWILAGMPTLYCFEEPLTTCDYCFTFAKTEKGSDVRTEFNEYLASVTQSGQLDAWTEKWANAYDAVGDDIPSLDTTSCPKNGKPLSVVTCADWAPYIYYSGTTSGSLVGLYMELLNDFCVKYGYTPTTESTLSIDAATMGMSSGVYDLFMYGITYSDERAENAYFSDPVCVENEYIFVRVTEVEGIDAKEYVGKQGFFTYLANSLEKNLIAEDRWQLLARGLAMTLLLSLASAVVGTVLGYFIYFLDSRQNLLLSAFGRLYINIFERLPDVLLLLILCYIVFGGVNISGTIVCILAFSLSFAAYVAEMFRSGVEAIPIGQTNAALALGFSKPKAFVKVVLPQAIRIILPVYKGQLVTLILETSIAGYIAVEDLTKMSDLIRALTFEALIPMLISALLYFVVTTVFGALMSYVEKKLDPSHRRRLPKWVDALRAENK